MAASPRDVEAQAPPAASPRHPHINPSPRFQQTTLGRRVSNPDIQHCMTFDPNTSKKIEAAMSGIDKGGVKRGGMSSLATWHTIFYLDDTIWANRILWTMLSKVILLSLVLATLVVFTSFDPRSIDTSRFELISNFLKVFVGFLLGFYMTSSVKRWGDSVEGFLQLGDAVRNMMAQLTALGVAKEHIDVCTRYGLLSAEFLISELEARALPNDEERMEMKADTISVLEDKGELTADEAETIAKVDEISVLMWVWIGSRIGRLSNDDAIPGMATPCYARLMTLAERASQGIRGVHVNSKVQMPFLYVHCLALLVHFNNVLCAISFGLTVGTAVAAILARSGIHIHSSNVFTKDEKGSIPGDVQAILTSFIVNIFSPTMYQAFLQIGLILSQPFDNAFGNNLGQLPTLELITDLKTDLKNAEFMANNIHGWEAPAWKAPKA